LIERSKEGRKRDTMDLLKAVKAAGIPIYGCAVDTALSGIKKMRIIGLRT
jgi:hypothetical protein